ncbi:hypothetical protein ACFQV2_31255 [Actinokineospora soli]|uniref:Uncharacterized protein n=1 Tax=Actinokineospora soli TaxID=1048753 RepID=A0ABW2TWA0_9PSEU
MSAPLTKVAVITAVLFGAAVTPAAAVDPDDGVLVYSIDFTPYDVYEKPGCYQLLPTAHVVLNHSDRPIRIHAAPACLGPSVPLQPGTGAHTAQILGGVFGSLSVPRG